jgi:hypothetical protein
MKNMKKYSFIEISVHPNELTIELRILAVDLSCCREGTISHASN